MTQIVLTAKTRKLRHLVLLGRWKREVYLDHASFRNLTVIAARHCANRGVTAQELYPNDPALTHRYVYRLRHQIGEEVVESQPTGSYGRSYTLAAHWRVRFERQLREFDDYTLRTELAAVPEKFFKKG